jgi:hypothetical protein
MIVANGPDGAETNNQLGDRGLEVQRDRVETREILDIKLITSMFQNSPLEATFR